LYDTMRREQHKQADPDIGVLAAWLLFSVQEELFGRLAQLGFDDVRPRHGAVLAYLDPSGTRPTELARLSQRRKQTIGAILDDLERLGYVERRPDPEDRRAALIVPTDRGRRFIEASDSIVGEIEARQGGVIGERPYAQLKQQLHTIVRARRLP
jgi:DNA-binding MarR family transcriptional regulator